MFRLLQFLAIAIVAFNCNLQRGTGSYTFSRNNRVDHFPSRSFTAPKGSEFLARIANLNLADREAKVVDEIRRGNVPDFLRKLVPITFQHVKHGGKKFSATIWVSTDYLSVGNSDDYVRVPLTPITAQHLADELQLVIPTRKIVDLIYDFSDLHLNPQPLAVDAAMNSPQRIAEHNAKINLQLRHFPSGLLTSGHKKDVVISSQLNLQPGRLAIYGWHMADGRPTQPLSLAHNVEYADYSHGVRLVHNRMLINGREYAIADVLKDPDLCSIISDEGALLTTSYLN